MDQDVVNVVVVEIAPGACLVLLDPTVPLDANIAYALLRLHRETSYWTVKTTPEKTARFVSDIVDGPGSWGLARWDWEPWSEVHGTHSHDPFTYIDLEKMDGPESPPLRWPGSGQLRMLFAPQAGSGHFGALSTDRDPWKLQFLVHKWAEAVDLLEPAFALIDDYPNNIHPKAGKDLRAYAWGVNIYGPHLIETIGHERLRTAPAYLSKPLPWGGWWIQLTENPFQARPDQRAALERHLDLARLTKLH